MLIPESGYFKDPSTVVCLEGLKSMGVKLAYLPLMKILHILGGDKKKFSEIIKTFRNVFFVYVKIGGNPTNSLQNYFANEETAHYFACQREVPLYGVVCS